MWEEEGTGLNGVAGSPSPFGRQEPFILPFPLFSRQGLGLSFLPLPFYPLPGRRLGQGKIRERKEGKVNPRKHLAAVGSLSCLTLSFPLPWPSATASAARGREGLRVMGEREGVKENKRK